MNKTLVVSSIALVLVGIIGLMTVRQSASEQTPVASATPLPTEQPMASPSPSTTITAESVGIDGKWMWQQTQMSDGKVISPAKPGVFSITLANDGTVGVTTDCNSASGTYTIAPDGMLSFSPNFAMTMMACENSQESEFIRQLTLVQTYLLTEAGQLALGLKLDSGSMMFSR